MFNRVDSLGVLNCLWRLQLSIIEVSPLHFVHLILRRQNFLGTEFFLANFWLLQRQLGPRAADHNVGLTLAIRLVCLELVNLVREVVFRFHVIFVRKSLRLI